MKDFLLSLLSRAGSFLKDGLLALVKKPITWLLVALLMAVAVICIQSRMIRQNKAEISRLEANQEALLTDVQYYEDSNGDLVATVNALTLRRDELENLIPSYAAEIEDLKLKLKNVNTLAHVSMETKAEIQAQTIQLPPPAPLQPMERPDTLPPTPYQFSYEDTWITVTGTVYPDSTSNVQIECRDSLTLVAHKTKKRCCRKSKIIKYDVTSSSPYSTITDLGYIELIE